MCNLNSWCSSLYSNPITRNVIASFWLHSEAMRAGADIVSAVSTSDPLCGNAHPWRVLVNKVPEKESLHPFQSHTQWKWERTLYPRLWDFTLRFRMGLEHF